MARRMKVYGWRGYRIECPPAANGSRQTREICLAPSIAAVARATGTGVSELRHTISETGNAEELRIANEAPGTVFWRPLVRVQEGGWTAAEKIDD